MKRMICLLTALTLLFAACCAMAEEKPEGWYTLSEDKSELTVRLDANPTTGYEWTASITNEDVLELISGEYVASEQSEGLGGAGGVYTAVFKVRVPDDPDFVCAVSSIDLIYARSFEEDSIAAHAVIDLSAESDGTIYIGNAIYGRPDIDTEIEYELNEDQTILFFLITGLRYGDNHWDFSISDENILQDLVVQDLPGLSDFGLTTGFAGSFFATNTPFKDEIPIVPGTTQLTFTFGQSGEGEVPLFNCVYNVTVAEDGTLSVE